MIYRYRNLTTGRVTEIERSMRNPPPYRMTIDGQEHERIWEIPASIVKDPRVGHVEFGPPVSMSLPFDQREGKIVDRNGHQVREHEDGTYSTIRGDRIIDSAESADRHAKLCGYERE